MATAAATIYWLIVAVWLGVLGVAIYFYIVNPIIFGAARLLLIVVVVDTIRDIIENVYFGVYFGSQYGLIGPEVGHILGQPVLLLMPKIMNVGAGLLVLLILLLHWLPKAAQERNMLGRLATVDGMTGLTNRRQFLILAEAECERSIRYDRPLSMLMLDIDHFKSINDRYGHDVGDKVIVEVAMICQQLARGTDITARLGGEEFGILLPETRLDEAIILAERLRAAVMAARMIALADPPLEVGVSIGASDRGDCATIVDLMKQADIALYEAKRAGRNRVSSFVRA